MTRGRLVEFPNIVDAVACAVVVQTGLAGHEVDRPEAWRIRDRIGISLGDIVIEGDDILGDEALLIVKNSSFCGGLLGFSRK